jgi:uncharacterized protein YutE (UPF0331/DUF86 family)
LYWGVDPERMHQVLQEDIMHLERFRAFALAITEIDQRRRDAIA